MFTFKLNKNYCVTTDKSLLNNENIARLLRKAPAEQGIYFGLFFNGKQIGFARLITDFVDVAIIVDFALDADYKNEKINQRTVGEAFLKIISKYPPLIRKPEFCFVINGFEQQLLIDKFNFSCEKEHKIMLRALENFSLPTGLVEPSKDIVIDKTILKENLPELLELLKTNAYWGQNYTLEKLELLTKYAECYYLVSNKKLVGFARVVTDYSDFASLWDVVIHENHRKKGLSMMLMHKVFSDPLTIKVKFWLLYTDDAHGLYKKFGFASMNEIANNTFIYKLRFQEALPSYCLTSRRWFFPTASKVFLDEEMTHTFLDTKRSNLSELLSDIHANLLK